MNRRSEMRSQQLVQMSGAQALASVSAAALLMVAVCGSGCATTVPVATATAEAMSNSQELPAPDERLKPLEFMAGRWVGVNPNKTVIEEHWMRPRGTSMMGMFRLIRLDKKPAFFEASQIVIEDGKVIMRMRHLHRKFEVPDDAREAYTFELESASTGKASFVGTGNAEGTRRVTYRSTGANTMEVEVEMDPAAKQPNFTSKYTRE